MLRNIARTLLLAVAGTLIVCEVRAQTPPLTQTPDGRPLVLTFDSDFAGPSGPYEPGACWRTRYGDDSYRGLDGRNLENNGELEIYVDSRLADSQGRIGLNPFRLDSDGHLEILAWPTPPALMPRLDNHPYVSGVITTQPCFWQTYGYFEMRARIPSGKGLWPAFWLLPHDQSWPPEIDVMESVGDGSHIYSTVHSTMASGAGPEARVTRDAFHTYAVSWDPRQVIFYVDSKRTGAVPTPRDLHKAMYMIANLAIGGDWPGSPDASTKFPAKMTIAYMRAYRFANR